MRQEIQLEFETRTEFSQKRRENRNAKSVETRHEAGATKMRSFGNERGAGVPGGGGSE